MFPFPNIDAEDRYKNWSIRWKRLAGKSFKNYRLPKDVLDFEAKQAFVLNYIEREICPYFVDSELLNDITLHHGYCAGIQFDEITNLQAGIAQKLLGVYEVELTDKLVQMGHRRYDWIVNIGAAEGLYSIQFSRNWKDIPVYSFEQDFATRQLLREMKELNKATDVVVLGEFKLEYMKLFEPGMRGLIFSDCEGFEKSLFNDISAPMLKGVDLVIETHDHLIQGVHNELMKVLIETHNTEEINQLTLKERCERVSEGWFQQLPEQTQIDLLNEDRHPSNRWIVATSKSV